MLPRPAGYSPITCQQMYQQYFQGYGVHVPGACTRRHIDARGGAAHHPSEPDGCALCLVDETAEEMVSGESTDSHSWRPFAAPKHQKARY